jgi:hypothetical protein
MLMKLSIGFSKYLVYTGTFILEIPCVYYYHASKSTLFLTNLEENILIDTVFKNK